MISLFVILLKKLGLMLIIHISIIGG